MMGAELTDMVTAPFSMHKTSGNDVMPKFLQNSSDMLDKNLDDVDMSAYVKSLQQKIVSNFNPPKFVGSPTVVVFFKISNNGRLESCKIIKSSNDDLYDYAALKAVKMSAPFDYLPVGYEKDVLKIQLTITKNAMSLNYF